MPALILVILFVAIPILEIYVIIQVGQEIGALWTVLLLVAESILGAWLVKREGGRAWLALNEALQTGRMPGRELADGALILIGGTLLLTPGFVTDVFGFFLVFAFTRPLARKVLGWAVARRVLVRSGVARSRRGVHQIFRDDPDGPRGPGDPGRG